MPLYADMDRSGQAMCLVFADEPGEACMCPSGHTCNYEVDDTYADTLWHLIVDDRVFDNCKDPLAEALGFDSWEHLLRHAKRAKHGEVSLRGAR